NSVCFYCDRPHLTTPPSPTRRSSDLAQTAYEAAVQALFSALDELESLLGRQRYLTGECLTEADWRLFTTLIRFDPVYVGHFKCRSEEHTSELQSRENLVCRLLLEKKK